MVSIQDQVQSISIGLTTQGFADILTLTATPNPATPGLTVTVTPTIKNTGATDTLWRTVYLNAVSQGRTEQSVANGATWSTAFTFTMPTTNATVKVDSGHIEGTLYVTDDTMSLTIVASAEAVFVGSPTYSPGQTVEPNSTVTVTYSVQNVGATGTLWGGLYDSATVPNLLGGYWEQSVNAGATVTKTVSISVGSTAFGGQLICGHIE